jgi:hypothetical protein
MKTRLAVKLLCLRTYILFMKDHDHKHSEGNEIVVIGWLIVAFSLTILYLMWHMFGYL